MKKNLVDELISNPSILVLNSLSKERIEASSTLFICAMDEELEGFRKALVFLGISYEAVHFKGGYYYKFVHSGCECAAMAVGITYFNIGRLAKCLFQGDMIYNEVICFGTCAGLDSQPIGEVVVSNNVVCNDLDLTSFGYLLGTINKTVTPSIGPLMVSGSKFLSDKKDKKKVLSVYPEAKTFDMETFMFVNFFKSLNIPFLCMKAISDNGEEPPSLSFEENVEFVSSISAIYALLFIERSSVKQFLLRRK